MGLVRQLSQKRKQKRHAALLADKLHLSNIASYIRPHAFDFPVNVDVCMELLMLATLPARVGRRRCWRGDGVVYNALVTVHALLTLA